MFQEGELSLLRGSDFYPSKFKFKTCYFYHQFIPHMDKYMGVRYIPVILYNGYYIILPGFLDDILPQLTLGIWLQGQNML